MRFPLLSTLCVLAAFSSTLQPALSAICVELCSPSPLLQAAGYNPCPEGQECRSNGCGHTCQTVAARKRKWLACNLACPIGFDIVLPDCTCKPSTLYGLLPVG